ncbi:MAG: DNA repair protein RadC [Bacilli bacterium]|jgi:DNA repair protein RadC|nr:DNA repair protein RadC [Bacilli bacterium]
MKVKEMPPSFQPRERMLKFGVENLSDVDLLSIILRTGTKDANVKEVSSSILASVGSITNMADVGIRELSKIKGVGNIKAITILAAIELGKRVVNKEIEINMLLNNSNIIHETFKSLFLNSQQEKVLAIYLDTKKRLISYKFIFIGTIDRSIIHPREIFNEALKVHASSLILMHNHPSNDLNPSKEDIAITNQIKECGDIIGIPLLDHLITNGKEYYSFYDKFSQK